MNNNITPEFTFEFKTNSIRQQIRNNWLKAISTTIGIMALYFFIIMSAVFAI